MSDPIGTERARALERLGVLDPTAPDADERRRLVELLISIGASDDDIVEYRDELPLGASMLRMRPRGARITLRELAERAAMPENDVMRFWRALGLPHAGIDDPVAYEQTVDLFVLLGVGRVLFGDDDAILQLARVLAESLARVADALISAFVVGVGAPAVAADPSYLALAEANAQAGELFDGVLGAIGIVLRHHIELARRPMLAVTQEYGSYEQRQLAVGFADLTGSTALAGRLSLGELGITLNRFETVASDVVHGGGGRVVKLIGDEVMFAVTGAGAAGDIACMLVDAIAAEPTLPPVRVGIAAGDVLVRYGDVFGPVVNLAARLVAQALPGSVLAPATLVPEVPAFTATPLGAVPLRGFDAPVEIVEIRRR